MKPDKVLEAARSLQLLHADRTDVIFHGYSMEPLLTEGDQVTIKEVLFVDIRVGDIIVSLEGDKYPARRVLFKKKDSLIVWRDNWAHREILEVSQKDILGQLVARRRKQHTLSLGSFLWKSLTAWAFFRLIPGRLIHYCPPVKGYLEKHHVKQGPVYD